MGKSIVTDEAIAALTQHEQVRLEHFIQFTENSSGMVTPDFDTLELDETCGFSVMVRCKDDGYVFRLKELY